MGESGSVLAAFVQTHLRVLDELQAHTSATVRARLGSACIERIEKATRLTWIPVEDHVEFTESVAGVVGPETARRLCRHMVLRSYQQPFLHPLFVAAVSLAGHSMARFAPWAARSWPALYRNAGEMGWTLEVDGRGCLRLGAPPNRILESPAYVQGLAGGLESLFDATETNGRIHESVEDGDVVFRLLWTPKR